MKIENLVKDPSLADDSLVKSPSTCPFMRTEERVKLTNYITGSQSIDTLHRFSQPIKCSGSACKGALMNGQSSAPNHRTKEEVYQDACEFQKEYQSSLKMNADEDLRNRLNEIKEEIANTGTYTMTYDELVFGAKLAWRNASRCIGRIQWNKLEVQDCRHITSTKEMFHALCKHVEYATNNGNIRSTITLFPQRLPGREDFRLWNPQLINFAGYCKEDGTIIGDPARLHLTRICQRLGWKGKGGHFDVLPWILSAPGEGVKMYEIPEELILMVDLEHPEHKSFAELNLKWYALPAVADMMFDVGGISFTAAPFNGWYMATEIGARNLCDVQRYNLSKEIAEKLGLDIAVATSLWKDIAVIEATRAVLYSFQKNQITIVDHHTASETFMKHMKTEQKLRGGCPADWVWIVPPISGSITPVFHQEMIVYNLKPSFEYQEKAWVSYKWPKKEKVKLRYSFSTFARVVSVLSKMISKVSVNRVQATILFATETGKSETFARRLHTVFGSSFNTRVLCMEDYELSHLRNEKLVIMVASTFGSGEPPDNGKVASLQKDRKLPIAVDRRLTDPENFNEFSPFMTPRPPNHTPLKRYAVFALGSSQYPDFCNFGKNLDKYMGDMEAKRITKMEIGDEMHGQEHTFNAWIPNIYQFSCEEFQIKSSEKITHGFNLSTWKKELFRFVPTNGEEKDILKGLSNLHNKSLFSLKIMSKKKLQPSYSDRQTLLIRLKTTDASCLNYQPGDHLGIFPSNPENVVNDLLEKFHASGFNRQDVIRLECLQDSDKWINYDRLPEASLRTYLSRYLDITSPPSSNLLGLFSTLAANPWDKYRLNRLSKVPDDYEEWRNFRFPHLADVLDEFPSIQLDPTLLISQLPLLQPRYYSISSSKEVAPDEVHITVSLVSFRTQDNKGPIHYGVCTSYLNNTSDEEVPCFIRSVPRFHLPEDPKIPIIMIGAGSGIAPFRSFWMDREHKMMNSKKDVDKAEFGQMHLFYGCRTSAEDNIYKQDIESLLENGIIFSAFTALSREPGQKKKYVQHMLKEEASLVSSVISRNGHVYVCGDANMAADVRSTIDNILKTDSNQTKLETLIDKGRYHEDVFGVLHRRERTKTE